MLREQTVVTSDKFLSTFRIRFNKFLRNAPTWVESKITPSFVIVTVNSARTNELISKTFNFDFAATVKYNIHQIKEWLVENAYPILYEIKGKHTGPYSLAEIKTLMEPGVSVEQLIQEAQENRETVEWRVLRVLLKKDQVFMEDLSTNKIFLYQLSFPVSVFLRYLKDGKWPKEEAFKRFSECSKVICEIDPNYKKPD